MRKRTTIQKVLVEEAITSLNNHPSAEELYEFIVKRYPHISKATVYRNLNSLVEKKKASRLEFPASPMRYDIMKENHHHLICDDCGKIIDVKIDVLPNLEDNVKVINVNGFKINGYFLTIRGKCSQCNN